jgi:hypothetical protein
MPDDEHEDFDGCSRLCRKRGEHTLKWGECEHGVRPSPTLEFFRVVTMADGYPACVYNPIPLAAILPWAASLTVDHQHQMLEEAADAEDPAACIEKWQRRATGIMSAQTMAINVSASPEPAPGYGPGYLRAAYEHGWRQGRYEAGG